MHVEHVEVVLEFETKCWVMDNREIVGPFYAGIPDVTSLAPSDAWTLEHLNENAVLFKGPAFEKPALLAKIAAMKLNAT